MPPSSNDLSNDQLIGLWTGMKRIRRFEETALYQTTLNNVYGGVHAYIGQEAVATGVCANLRKDDCISSTHRGHGHCIAKGASLERMMAELFGREDGYCRGKGGSQHIADFEIGMLGANGIVGSGYAMAAGAALRAQRTGSDRVAVCFFGDGAVGRGTFHETLNLAALLKLPLIFACENNQWAQWVSVKANIAADPIAGLANAHGIPGFSIDGQDVRAVWSAAKQAVDRARSGSGATLLVFDTQRYYGHNSADMQVYRTKPEVARLRAETDPIDRFEKELLAAGVIDEDGLTAIAADIEAEIERAVEFALASRLPPPEQLTEDVFAPVGRR